MFFLFMLLVLAYNSLPGKGVLLLLLSIVGLASLVGATSWLGLLLGVLYISGLLVLVLYVLALGTNYWGGGVGVLLITGISFIILVGGWSGLLWGGVEVVGAGVWTWEAGVVVGVIFLFFLWNLNAVLLGDGPLRQI